MVFYNAVYLRVIPLLPGCCRLYLLLFYSIWYCSVVVVVLVVVTAQSTRSLYNSNPRVKRQSIIIILYSVNDSYFSISSGYRCGTRSIIYFYCGYNMLYVPVVIYICRVIRLIFTLSHSALYVPKRKQTGSDCKEYYTAILSV